MSLEEYSFSARRLTIDLVRLQGDFGMAVSDLLAAGKLFDIKDSAMRVVLTRLQKEGAIQSIRRGVYTLGEQLKTHNSEILGWRQGEKRCKEWKGDWIFVQFGKVADRTARRHSINALTFLGFKEGLDNTWVRPNNLKGGYPETLQRLEDTGLESGTPSYLVSELDSTLEATFKTLWDTQAYNQRYAEVIDSLKTSENHLKTLSLDAALKESFLQGGRAIHVLVTDPMLPAPLSDETLRQSLTDAMLHYDNIGRSYWRTFTQIIDPSGNLEDAVNQAETKALSGTK